MALPLNKVINPSLTRRPAAGQGLTLNDKGQVVPPTVHLEPYTAGCTSNTALASTPTDITGASFTIAEPGTYFLITTFDMAVTGAGIGVAVGAVNVAGTILSEAATMDEGSVRATVSQAYFLVVTARSTAVKLVGAKTINAGTVLAMATNTTIRAFPVA